MKVLALSDEVVDWIYSPAIVERCAGVELVIGCGDLPMHYMEYVTSMLNVPSCYVRGNHDLYEIGESGVLKTEPQGWIDLDLRRKRIGSITLAGLQGCVRYKPHAPYQYSQRMQRLRALWLLRTMMLPLLKGERGVDVLVTHAPPFGIHDGSDLAHTGFVVYEWLIRVARPRYLLHGHQHRNYAPRQSGETRVNDTLVVNVHPYRLLEI
ncbi:MAG: metallophosphoesterase family protein [Anaerolineae bacterium]|nr:metallophosphoesterase family protein [Thermoflexales bacterium]MDW8408133.1 metallophosphoesterase family protein [Anaerolineae bacterium]